MAELKEIFEMVTQRTEPDLNAWQDQEQRQRTRSRRRRAAALGVAAAILVVLVAFAATSLRGPNTTQPLTSPAPPLHTTTDLVGFDAATGASSAIAAHVAPFAAAAAPDGSQLAFIRVTDGHPQIFVSPLDGGRARQVTGLAGQAGCACGATDPTWIDGSTIAFTGVLESGDHRIYVVDLTTGRVDSVPQGPGASWDVTPDWSTATDRLVYAEGSWNAVPPGSGTILTTALGGTRPAPAPVVAQRGATAPDVSPDGRRIVYQANIGGGTALFVTDGHGTTRLTDGPDDTAPAWSPDGTQIAFVRDGSVAIVNVATGEIRELGHGGDPSWSADGATVYAWTTG
jgi:Tol biopolymer transport system component